MYNQLKLTTDIIRDKKKKRTIDESNRKVVKSLLWQKWHKEIYRIYFGGIGGLPKPPTTDPRLLEAALPLVEAMAVLVLVAAADDDVDGGAIEALLFGAGPGASKSELLLGRAEFTALSSTD